MADFFEKGYKQAVNDFIDGKGYKPHDMKNLVMLVIASDKQNEAFLRGYRMGYDYCAEQQLQKYAQDALDLGASQGKNPSQSFFHRFPRSSQGFSNTPKDEPEY